MITGGGINKIVGATSGYSTIGGGGSNTATGGFSTVAGGRMNVAGNNRAAVGGGEQNAANGIYSIIGGGSHNKIDTGANYSAILGGYNNKIEATGDFSYLFGLYSTLTEDSTFMVDLPHIRFGDEVDGYEFPEDDGTLGQVMQTDGGGQLSWVTAATGGDSKWTVADSILYTDNYLGISKGGANNYYSGDSAQTIVNLGVACTSLTNYFSTISGGRRNKIDGSNYATIGGGDQNIIDWGGYSTICGGRRNSIYQGISASAIVAGDSNVIYWGSDESFIGGGTKNKIVWGSPSSVITGGVENSIDNGEYCFIGGGYSNMISGGDVHTAAIGGGAHNHAGGKWSTIPGGRACSTSANYSFAAGRRAKALHDGSFVWADSTDADFSSTGPNQFSIRAENGVRIAVDAGESKATDIGERYRDNSIVAWGLIASSGAVRGIYGVESVTHNSTGNYTVTLTATATSTFDICVVASPEIDTQPTSAASVRIVSTDVETTNSVNIYVNNGNFDPVDNDFSFLITAK
ncbi:MAG: hypothetical protein GY841_17650 [FCB group bacterium]|nr:hypothetical protein [FCB group bacterium]